MDMDEKGFAVQPQEASQLGLLPAYTLDVCFAHFAAQPFSLEQLEALGTSAAGGAELLVGLQALRRSGWVQAVKKTWGERLFFIPLPVFLSLQHEKLGQLQLSAAGNPLRGEPLNGSPGAGSRIKLLHPAKPGLADDLFRALSVIAKGELPLTAKGTVHQRSLGKFAAAASLKDEDVEDLGLRYPQQDAYPPAAAVILDLALSLGLAERGDGAWRVREKELRQWLGLNKEQMDSRLLRELLERYVPANAGLQHFACALLLPWFEAGRWYSTGGLIKQLELNGVKTPADDTGRRWVQSWLTALAAFGWTELGNGGESGEDELHFRWVSKPHPADIFPAGDSRQPDEAAKANQPAFFVQPDYEVLVPPGTPYTLRWELELCCELVSSDIMTTYRVSRKGVAAALEHGRTPTEVLALLARHSASGVPDNVRAALEQWGRELGRLSFAQVTLLRCADGEAAEKVALDQRLAPLLQRLGPLDFAVEQANIGQVRRELKRLGMEPLDNAGPGGLPEQQPLYPRALPPWPDLSVGVQPDSLDLAAADPFGAEGGRAEEGLGARPKETFEAFKARPKEAFETAEAFGAYQEETLKPAADFRKGASAAGRGKETPEAAKVRPAAAEASAAAGNRREAGQDRFQGWIYAGHPVSLYQADDGFPDMEELLPGYREIPGAWTKELRTYHSSTVKQLLQRALDWRTRVELGIRGTTLTALPLWIKGEGQWRAGVLGRVTSEGGGVKEERLEFGPEELEGVRIIFPSPK